MTVSIDQLMPRTRWDAEPPETVAIVEEVDVALAADAAVPLDADAVNVPLPTDEEDEEFDFESAPNPIFPLSKSNTV